MNISYRWLKEYVDLQADPYEAAEKLTAAGVVVDRVTPVGEGISGVVVGHVVSREKHPEADKLSLCRVDAGDGNEYQVICGAPNVDAGQNIPFAMIGARLPGGVKIKKAKLRGIESQGMICSASELGIDKDLQSAEEKEGIWVLPEDAPLGTDVLEYLMLQDHIFELDLTPNRSDCLSVINVARELAAIYGLEIKKPQTEYDADAEGRNDFSVEIADSFDCGRYIAKCISGVKIKQSPLWMQHYLRSAGMRPISNVVDITNFIMLETGQPLHAFDLDAMKKKKILVRRAVAGEKLITLDSAERTLTDEDILITDDGVPVGLAGVMGGENTEVTGSTETVLLESAHFNPRLIRLTSQRLGLRSEASLRFEKNADAENSEFASERAAYLFAEYAEGKVSVHDRDVYPVAAVPAEVSLSFSRVNKVLGTDIASETMKDILERLKFTVVSENAEGLTVQVPSYRKDIFIEEDLIEEVARMYGYDRIPTTLPEGKTVRGVYTPGQRFRYDITTYMAGLGFRETVNYSFVKPEETAKFSDGDEEKTIRVLNPLSEEQAVMRRSLLGGLLRNAAFNVKRKNWDLRLFEIGKTYSRNGEMAQDNLAEEKWVLCAVMSGVFEKNWQKNVHTSDFYEMKGVAEALLEHLKIPAAEFRPSREIPYLHPGQTAEIIIGGETAGHVGRIHPLTGMKEDLGGNICVLELDLEVLFRKIPERIRFVSQPKYPAVLRDFAFKVKADKNAADIVKTAKENGGELLQSVEIFDVYKGMQLGKDEKSIAFSLSFQSSERTLTDEEVNGVTDLIIEKITEEHGGELRK